MDGVEFGSASKVGRGGMEAKVASAWDAAQAGVVTVIANGKKSDVLLKARPSTYTPQSQDVACAAKGAPGLSASLLPAPACLALLQAGS